MLWCFRVILVLLEGDGRLVCLFERMTGSWSVLLVAAALLEVVRHAYIVGGQSEPDLLTACAIHLVDVAHHRISGKT